MIHLHPESKHIEHKDKDKDKRNGAPKGDTLASRVQRHRTQNAFMGYLYPIYKLLAWHKR